MELRRLDRKEHGKTRKLWEDIFLEDTPEFLDYYYSIRAAENDIYVIEEDGDIRAMLQLNPYKMVLGEYVVDTHYIVAVATDERYRKRRFMAKLLERAMEDMEKQGEPFTFLMPAAEAIYYPHGFRFVYEQKRGTVTGKGPGVSKWELAEARAEDCSEMAKFANGILEKEYEVYALRDAHYYERLLLEFESECGGMLLVKEGGELIGMFGYAKGEAYEIMEPLFLDGYEEAFREAVYNLTKKETEVECAAYGNGKKPMIMARVLNVRNMLSCVGLGEEVAQEIENAVREGEISIGELTQAVFGTLEWKRADFSVTLQEKLKAIRPFRKIFLNEVV